MQIAVFGTTELATFAEMQDISRRHKVLPFLAERSDMHAWMSDLRHNPQQILHFAGHIGSDDDGHPNLLVLGEHLLTPDDVVNLARITDAQMLFFNSCNSALFANYAVRNGVACSIYTTAPLRDSVAWKYPIRFYEQVARQEEEREIVDLRKAFESTVDRTGLYGWASNGLYERDLLSPIVLELGQLHRRVSEQTDATAGHLYHYEARLERMARYVFRLAVGSGSALLLNLALSVVSMVRGG